jgi:hypothetical protein
LCLSRNTSREEPKKTPSEDVRILKLQLNQASMERLKPGKFFDDDLVYIGLQ